MNGEPEEIAKERQKFAIYLMVVHSMSPEGNELRKLQDADEVWKEVTKRVIEGWTPKLLELQGTVQEVLIVIQLFNPFLFVIHNGV